MTKFPRLIHVVEEGSIGGKFLAVYKDGISGLDIPNQDVAIYERVSTGKLEITKRFVQRSVARRRRT